MPGGERKNIGEYHRSLPMLRTHNTLESEEDESFINSDDFIKDPFTEGGEDENTEIYQQSESV